MNVPPRGTTLPDGPLPDGLGERLSAYFDSELTPAEGAEAERALASDAAARRFVDDLGQIRAGVRAAPLPKFTGDLGSRVVAEALRRQAAGQLPADDEGRVEPEGYLGLPFGKASRGWGWALVAAAAAVLIGFYGRPPSPPGRSVVTTGAPTPAAAQFAAYLQAMQRVAPGMQVVNFQATPDTYARLRERLTFQPVQRAQLPGELTAVSQNGVVVRPAEATSEAAEQLVYVDADEAELDRLLGELGREEEGSVVRLEAPRAARGGAAPAIRAVPLRVEATPEALETLRRRAPAPAAAPRRFIVLRIQVRPAQP